MKRCAICDEPSDCEETIPFNWLDYLEPEPIGNGYLPLCSTHRAEYDRRRRGGYGPPDPTDDPDTAEFLDQISRKRIIDELNRS